MSAIIKCKSYWQKATATFFLSASHRAELVQTLGTLLSHTSTQTSFRREQINLRHPRQQCCICTVDHNYLRHLFALLSPYFIISIKQCAEPKLIVIAVNLPCWQMLDPLLWEPQVYLNDGKVCTAMFPQTRLYGIQGLREGLQAGLIGCCLVGVISVGN